MVQPACDRFPCFLSSPVPMLPRCPVSPVPLPLQDGVPPEVPAHVFHEVCRLRAVATAATNAKAEFLLTDSDLRSIPHTDKDRWGGWVRANQVAR